MRPETLHDLANAAGFDVPETRGFGNFAAVSGMYVAACNVLTSADALARLPREVIEDAAPDGATWIDPAVSPPHHNQRIGPPTETLDIILSAASDASSAN